MPLHPGTPLFLPSVLLARPAEISMFELFWIDKHLNYNRIRLNQDCCLKCQCVVKLCKAATARNTPPRLLRFSALPVFWRGLLEQKPGTACYPPNINEINQQHETTQCSRLRGSLMFFGGWSMYWLYNSCTSFASASLAIFISSFILDNSPSARASGLSMSESYPSARICHWLFTMEHYCTMLEHIRPPHLSLIEAHCEVWTAPLA